MEKRKRSTNYSEQDKISLLSIVNKYKHVIENKITNAVYGKQKQEAWAKITTQFNAVSVSGKRDWQQLRHLYTNLKQKTRKNVAQENKMNYMNIMENNENIKTEIDLKEIKRKAVDDKKEIIQTGGGSYKKKLTDSDAQVLALIAPQIKPLSNPYDDAANYFGDFYTREDGNEVVLSEEVADDYIDLAGDNHTDNIDFNIATSKTTDDIEEITLDVPVNPKPVTKNTLDVPVNPKPFTKNPAIINPKNASGKTNKKKTSQTSNLKNKYFALKVQHVKQERKQNFHLYQLQAAIFKTNLKIAQQRLKKLTSK